MSNGSTGGPVAPLDLERIRRMFGDSVCVECECLGHICRPCRAARYNASLRPPALRERLRTWWRSTTLCAMNADYPVALPLVVCAGVAWGALCVAVPAMLLVGHL